MRRPLELFEGVATPGQPRPLPLWGAHCAQPRPSALASVRPVPGLRDSEGLTLNFPSVGTLNTGRAAVQGRAAVLRRQAVWFDAVFPQVPEQHAGDKRRVRPALTGSSSAHPSGGR